MSTWANWIYNYNEGQFIQDIHYLKVYKEKNHIFWKKETTRKRKKYMMQNGLSLFLSLYSLKQWKQSNKCEMRTNQTVWHTQFDNKILSVRRMYSQFGNKFHYWNSTLVGLHFSSLGFRALSQALLVCFLVETATLVTNLAWNLII